MPLYRAMAARADLLAAIARSYGGAPSSTSNRCRATRRVESDSASMVS